MAVLATEGFKQAGLTEPVKALKQAGATVHVVAPKDGEIQGWKHHDVADHVPVEVDLDRADPDRYDGLVLPGGVVNPDQLRLVPEAIDSVRAFVRAGKLIAAICHGPWTLIDAGGVEGRRMAFAPGRPDERRRPVGGRARGDRPRAGDVAQTGRPPRVLPQDGRGVRERPSRREAHAAE